MYPGYKGQRPPTPEPIIEAVKQLRDLIRVMGIPEIIVPGIEADDVIGTVASRALKEGLQVAIASPDKVSRAHIASLPCMQCHCTQCHCTSHDQGCCPHARMPHEDATSLSNVVVSLEVVSWPSGP